MIWIERHYLISYQVTCGSAFLLVARNIDEISIVVRTLPLALIADYTNTFSSENKTADWLLLPYRFSKWSLILLYIAVFLTPVLTAKVSTPVLLHTPAPTLHDWTYPLIDYPMSGYFSRILLAHFEYDCVRNFRPAILFAFLLRALLFRFSTFLLQALYHYDTDLDCQILIPLLCHR